MTEKVERIYIIPLRDAKKTSKFRRAKRAINILREFVARHMHVSEENVKIDNEVNEKIWEKGVKRPPSKIKVLVRKEGDIAIVKLAT